MVRQLLWPCAFVCALFLIGSNGAAAEDLPTRKAGLWEMKVAKTGSQQPEMTLQHCTDETTDKDMNNMVSPMAKQICSKQDIQKTATGYVSDSVCSVAGMTTTSHAEITGDFSSAYTVKSTSHAQGGAVGAAGRDSTMTIAARWLGACKPDQKPGDVVMPDGRKVNMIDLQQRRSPAPSR